MPLSKKTKKILRLSFYTVVLGYLAFLFFGSLWVSVPDNGLSGADINPNDTFDLPAPMPDYNQPMTYGELTDLQTRADRLKQWREQMERGFGSSTVATFMSIHSIQDNDRCCRIDGDSATTRYYLGLPGYTLRPGALFHVRKGRYYLSYPVWESTRRDGARSGFIVIREVPFRYSYTKYEDRNFNGEGTVLIPINASTYKVLHYTLWVIMVPLLIIVINVLLAGPIRILVRIAQGEPFHEKNIRQLNNMVWLIGIGLVVFSLFRGLLNLIFRIYLVPQLHFKFLELFTWQNLLILVSLFIIAKAFRKGYDLQIEQALTL